MKRRHVIALATVLIAVAAGGAYAAIPDNQGVIHACYKTDGGQLRVTDAATCNPSETSLSWSQAGPTGPQGPQGPQGPAGPPGPGGDVFTEFSTGGIGQPVPIAPINTPPVVAELPLAAGSYTISAALEVDNNVFDTNYVGCSLAAGTDEDETLAHLAQLTDPGDETRLVLQTVHTFAAAGKAQLRCSGLAEAIWTHLRITAVRAGSVTNFAFPAP
jgi:hypothetical protein